MFATLIIKNIGNLYTCDDHFTIYHHAFIAMHHDKIIDLGQHDYHKWVDPCTFVIDAASRAVIPGLIEADFHLVKGKTKTERNRKTDEALHYHQKNGTLTVVSNDKINHTMPLLMDIIHSEKSIQTCKNVNDYKEDCVLSCTDSVFSLQAMGFLLVSAHICKEWQALKSMTCMSAEKCDLLDRGSLEIGKLADVLVLNDVDIHSFFESMGHPTLSYIIKKGIPVYPIMRRV